MVFEGVLHKKLQFKEFEKFNKSVFVVKNDKVYLKFDAIGEASNNVESIEEGTKVTVHYTVTGRLWVNKEKEEVYFNSLNVQTVFKQAEQQELPISDGEEDDDLPF